MQQDNVMDYKEAHLLAHFHRRLAGDVFDETDVFGFLTILRQHAPARSPTREFGDFLAHRDRDRGIFRAFLLAALEQFNASSAIASSAPAAPADFRRALTVQPLFSEAMILADVNTLLGRLGRNPLDTVLAEPMTACIISLLQSARLVDDSGNNLGTLQAVLDEERLGLFAGLLRSDGTQVVVPVLTTPNRYQRVVRHDPRDLAVMPNTAFSLIRVRGELRMHSE